VTSAPFLDQQLGQVRGLVAQVRTGGNTSRIMSMSDASKTTPCPCVAP
jgi:hypothetical protein